MKWLTNTTLDPKASCSARLSGLEVELEYRLDKVVGPPKATLKYTTEELEKMGIAGLYDPNPQPTGRRSKVKQGRK